jgi:hypothetical protein
VSTRQLSRAERVLAPLHVIVGMALACALSACRAPAEDSGVATLVEAHGDVRKRVGSARDDDWRPAPLGTRFRLGDAIRTGAGATARVEVAAGGSARLGEHSLLRFEDRVSYRLSVGLAELEAGHEPLVLQMEIGRARIDGGARVRTQDDGGRTRLTVLDGAARFDGRGAPVPMRAGDVLVVDRSTGQITIAQPPPAPAAPPAPPAPRLEAGPPAAPAR